MTGENVDVVIDDGWLLDDSEETPARFECGSVNHKQSFFSAGYRIYPQFVLGVA